MSGSHLKHLRRLNNPLEKLAMKFMSTVPSNTCIKERTGHTFLCIQSYLYKCIPLIIKFHTFSGRKKLHLLLLIYLLHNFGSFDQLCHFRHPVVFTLIHALIRTHFYFRISIPKLFCELSC